DGGSAVAPITQDYNTAVTAPANPTKTGYTFAGWTPAVPTTMPAENVTVKAQWTINQYTITFDTDGGSEVAPITQDYNTDVTAPANPTKTGYTFDGWDKEIPTKMPAENVTITAKWTINQYTITFGDTGDSVIAPITQDYGTAITAPANPTKTGYTFAGWSPAVPETMPAESITINATWTVNSYEATFIAEGVTVDTLTVNYGEAINAPDAPEKSGFRFVKWSPAVPETMPAENLEFTAIYEVKVYGVNYYVNGELVGAVSSEYGETIATVIPSYTVPEGYVFDGWYTNEQMTVKLAEGATVGSEAINLYASATRGTYDAIFMVDGSVYETVPTVYDEYIVAPADPTKDGFVFNGWEPEVGVMDTEGKTFNATWTADAYTVTYVVDGAEYEKYTIAYGDSLDVPADPEKDGFNFLGWSTVEGAETAEALPATMPANNVTYYAVFSVGSFSLTVYEYEASAHGPEAIPAPALIVKDGFGGTYAYGEVITIPTADDMAIENYNFTGWVDQNGVTYASDAEITMPDYNLELTPTYKRIPVKLVPSAGSTTVIERDSVKESIADGTVTSEPYAEPASYDQWFIYGLKTGLRDTTMKVDDEAGITSAYIDIQGDGYTVVTPVVRGRLGTGALVEVYDYVTGEKVEQFHVVIFGDIDGNSVVNSADSSLISEEIMTPVWSGRNNRIYYLFKAANLDGNRVINSADSSLLDQAVTGELVINQVIGRTE
ncbi:MAG: InlB B-repeat-containing protein, partial [Acutalibacteraceae bacterium]